LRFIEVFALIMGTILIFSISAEAQSSASVDSDVEALYDRYDREEETQRSRTRKKPRRKFRKKNLGKLSDLSKLAPFSDVAIISRKYLPKTSRIEISVAPMFSLNNAFFNNFGAALRGSYYFSEKFAVEGMYFFLDESDRDITTKLENKIKITTESLVVPKSFFGGAIKWMPIYGKMALLENKIVPYDLYFTAGAGITGTGEADGEATIHLGAGQIFAYSKSIAFRWDITWNIYQATVIDTDTNQEETANHSDLFLSIGVSFFIPEAKYR